jgi:hypothetical protein
MTYLRLSDAQVDVLVALAGIEPRWTLTGGGALAGFHLGHRSTRDLDLFLTGRSEIAELRGAALARLRARGFELREIQSHEGMCSLEVRGPRGPVLLELVAEPVSATEEAVQVHIEDEQIWVDTAQEILVNKLCALLHRSELRDLVDIHALVRSGCDLEKALRDAPRKDGGFSGLSLGWVLKGWPVTDLARDLGFEEQAEALASFRDELLATVAGEGG